MGGGGGGKIFVSEKSPLSVPAEKTEEKMKTLAISYTDNVHSTSKETDHFFRAAQKLTASKLIIFIQMSYIILIIKHI